MSVVKGMVLGDQLCRALGLDPGQEKITSIKIECPVDGVAKVTIERLEFADAGEEFVKVMEQYELKSKSQ